MSPFCPLVPLPLSVVSSVVAPFAVSVVVASDSLDPPM